MRALSALVAGLGFVAASVEARQQEGFVTVTKTTVVVHEEAKRSVLVPDTSYIYDLTVGSRSLASVYTQLLAQESAVALASSIVVYTFTNRNPDDEATAIAIPTAPPAYCFLIPDATGTLTSVPPWFSSYVSVYNSLAARARSPEQLALSFADFATWNVIRTACGLATKADGYWLTATETGGAFAGLTATASQSASVSRTRVATSSTRGFGPGASLSFASGAGGVSPTATAGVTASDLKTVTVTTGSAASTSTNAAPTMGRGGAVAAAVGVGLALARWIV